MNLNMPQLAIIHRLPQSYRWLSGQRRSQVELIPDSGLSSEKYLIGLKLLSYEGDKAWLIMERLSLALNDIDVESVVIEYQGEPCLFVEAVNEQTATCHLKNCGVAIAESMSMSHHR